MPLFLNHSNEYTTMDIFNDIIHNLTKWQILEKARRDEERPMGFLLSYIRDNYNLPKTQGWEIAEKVLDYYQIKN